MHNNFFSANFQGVRVLKRKDEYYLITDFSRNYISLALLQIDRISGQITVSNGSIQMENYTSDIGKE